MTAPLKAIPGDKAVVDYLTPLRSPIPVATKFPDALVRMTRVVLAGGGGRRGLVLQDSTVAVECIGDTYAQASDDMADVDAYMMNARFVSEVIRDVQSFGSPVELPIPNSTKFRLTATYQVTVRASAI